MAAFANPFGEDRASLDLEMSGSSRTATSSVVLDELTRELEKKIGACLENHHSFSAEEKNLFHYAVLFHVYHKYCNDFDLLIERQLKSDKQSLPVGFAKDLLSSLNALGIGRKEGLRYLGFFFQLRRAFYFIRQIKGESPSVKRLRKELWNNIFTYDVELYEEYLWDRMEDFSTLILGETGTGKGMAAAAIGRSGFIPFDYHKGCFKENFASIFISINLSQFSEHLVESELFGHKKGSFTGAVESHKGIFTRCSPHGAIFLDEIGEVSIPLQIKLLQVLQERQFCPVGGHEREKFSGRIIAATNRPLHQMRREGKFRDDFYYRLCSDTIEVPTLQQRLQEKPGEMFELVSITLKRILGYTEQKLAKELHGLIQKSAPQAYSWPGNIRELEQCVRQMMLNRSYTWSVVDVEEDAEQFHRDFRLGNFTASQLLSIYCMQHYERLGTYEEVARLMDLDRRTVKKYIEMAQGKMGGEK